jgi:hypothetical protein
VIFITTYRVKEFLSKDERRELLAAFQEQGTLPTTTAHYLTTDGTGGLVIDETDDLEPGYRNALNYLPWLTFETKPYLTIEQALPHLLDYIA